MSDEPRYVLDDEPDKLPEPLVTKSGRVLTETDLEAMVAEAERGYNVAELRALRDPARPSSLSGEGTDGRGRTYV